MAIAFDTETELISPANKAPALVCLTYADRSTSGIVHANDGAREKFKALIIGEEQIIGANVAFDMGVAAAKWPDLIPEIFQAYEDNRVHDVLIRERLIDVSRGKTQRLSLADVTRIRLDIELAKGADTWRLRYGELIDTPLTWWPEDAVSYAVRDAQVTRDCFVAQEKHAHLFDDEHRQTRAAWWLHLAACWGLRTDRDGVEALRSELEDRRDDCAALLIKDGLLRPNGTRDTKKAQQHMRDVCHAQGLALVLTAKGKKPALDRSSCESTGDELLEAYAAYSSLNTQLTNFVSMLETGITMPIHPRFNVLLVTGRTSSSPNVQNVRRSGGFRECFVPRPGFIFAAADYSSFELCTLAQVCLNLFGYSKLADALNGGLDPHLQMSSLILGITYDEALARRHEDEIQNARQIGKIANFGFPGGMGIARFVLQAWTKHDVRITESEAKQLKDFWFRAWPEMREYFRLASTIADNGGDLVHQGSNRHRGGATYCEICNLPFQGMAADAAKRAGFLIAKACYVDRSSPLFGSRIVNFVHDEFILETADNGNASAAAIELARFMVLGAKKYLTDVSVVAEPLLMRRWSKGAKPKWENGKLVAA